MVRDHTSKAFEPKAIDHHIVDFCGKNQVLVKDNYGNTKKVHIKDVKPIEMDIATAEFFRKERKQCTTWDAKHIMPIKQIPDLQWEFIDNIDLMESDKGVIVYCKELKEKSEQQKWTTEGLRTWSRCWNHSNCWACSRYCNYRSSRAHRWHTSHRSHKTCRKCKHY